MFPEVLLEDMPSNLSVGELKTEPLTGLLLTLGMKTGVTKEPSRSEEEPTNVESKIKSSLDCPNSE